VSAVRFRPTPQPEAIASGFVFSPFEFIFGNRTTSFISSTGFDDEILSLILIICRRYG
jgi:hypothetical protein